LTVQGGKHSGPNTALHKHYGADMI